MGSLYTHRDGLQACASSGGRRRKKNFPRGAAKAAWRWIRDAEATLELPAEPLLGGPAHTTLGGMLRLYAELYTVGKKSWHGELQRINRYLVPCGLAPLARVAGEGREFKLQELPLRTTPATTLPRPFAAQRAARAAKRPLSNRLRAELARLPVAAIDKAVLRRFIATMTSEGLSGSTVRNEFALLKHAFNCAVDEWNWTDFRNPTVGLKLPRPAPPREVTFTRSDEVRLRAELARADSPFLLPYLELAIETTGRRGSLLALEWSSIDLERRELVFHDTKSGHNVTVPLTQRAVAVLQRLPRDAHEPRVFPMSADALDAAWDRACQRAGVVGLRKHDLRHVGSTRHAKRLRSTTMLMQITGHRTLNMVQRYVRFMTDDVLEALDATEDAAPPLPLPPDQSDMAPAALQRTGRARHCAGRAAVAENTDDELPDAMSAAVPAGAHAARRRGAQIVSLAEARRRRHVA